MGKLTYVRVYSGTLKSGEFVYNSTRDKRQRIGRLFLMHANKQQAIDELPAGNVGAVVGLSDTHTGDTICHMDHPIILESIEFPAPVIDMAVRPASRADRDKLARALARLSEEFADILRSGTLRAAEPSQEEISEGDFAELPRLALNFNQRGYGRLRRLIDALNAF